ncbi:unnamed protein product [Sphagnum balticum]
MSVEVATGGAIPSPEVSNGVAIHQGLGVDEKGVAPSPMKHQETRTTGMAVSDAILVVKPGKSAQNTDGVFESIVDGMNEQLDNVGDLEVKCLTEEGPGILEKKSPKLGLFLNALASSEDKEMVDVDGTTETGDVSMKVEDATEDNISAEVVEATKEIDNILELNEEAAIIQQDRIPLGDDETDDFHEAADDQYAAKLVEAVRNLEKTATLVAENINIENKFDAEVEEPFTSVLPPSLVEDDPVNQGMIMSCTDEQQTYVTQPASKLVDVLVEVSQQKDPSSRIEFGMEIRDDSRVEVVRMELPDSFVAPDDAPMVPMQVDSQVSPKLCYIDSSMQSPEVTIGTVVGELESVNRVASLSSNHCEQEAKVVVPESDQPLSDMEVVVLNMNIVQDEFEETSNAAGFADKHQESPRLSGISEVVPFATSKSKEIVVGPEAALCDCAVQNEFQNNPTMIEDNESSKKTGTVTEGRKERWYDGSGIAFSIVLVVLWSLLPVEEASADALLLSADDTFVKQRTKAC